MLQQSLDMAQTFQHSLHFIKKKTFTKDNYRSNGMNSNYKALKEGLLYLIIFVNITTMLNRILLNSAEIVSIK